MWGIGRGKKKKTPLSSFGGDEDLLEKLERKKLGESSKKKRGRSSTQNAKTAELAATSLMDKDLEAAKKVFEGIGAKEEEEKKVISQDEILKKSPEEMFEEFDTDGSGLIEFGEFQAMLPALGVVMTEAKARRYFRTLDADKSGALGMDEFKAALFACDPNSGNSIGFAPSATLTPKDAFKLFDDDDSGRIDEDEFRNVLEYLGVHVTDAKAEKFFKKYDADGSGFIEYKEFRKIWLHLSDIRGELEKRGIVFSKRTPKAILLRRLEELIDEEEQREENALAQAKAWRDWQIEQKEKNQALQAAKARAQSELMDALDVGGQVYAFGTGAHGQFSADPARPSKVFKRFEFIQDLWKSRVMPNGPIEIKYRNIGQAEFSSVKRTKYPLVYSPTKHTGAKKKKGKKKRKKNTQLVPLAKGSSASLQYDTDVVDEENLLYDPESVNDFPGRDELHLGAFLSRGEDDPINKDFRFSRKPDSVLNKLVRGADFGVPDVYESDESDDGNNEDSRSQLPRQQEDEVVQENDPQEESDENDDEQESEDEREWTSPFTDLVCAVNTAALWGRRVVSATAGINTAFALTDTGQILAWGGRDQWWTELPPNATSSPKKRGHLTQRSELMLSLVDHNPWPDVVEPDLQLEETEEEKYEKLKFVTSTYYKVWEPCPHENLKMQHMENIILPRISFEQVELSLGIRGFSSSGLNKRQMLDTLHDALQIEKKHAGTGFMNKYLIAEAEILVLRRDKKDKKAALIEQTGKSIWRPLQRLFKEFQEDRERERNELRVKRELLQNAQYEKWRASLTTTQPSLESPKKKKRQDASIENCITVVTERGSGPKHHSSQQVGFSSIQAGAFHVAAIDVTGCIYSWGDGNFGRLGQGQGPGFESHPSNRRKRFSAIDSGFTNEYIMDSRRTLVSVLDAAQKATQANKARYDVSAPKQIKDLSHRYIKQVTCGFSHSAAVTEQGDIFIWGGGNDGKLGLGPITEEYECYCPYPTQLAMPERARVKQVSCGNAHTGAVTDDGRLFMWGCADSGRLGLGQTLTPVVNVPTLVRTLFVAGVKVDSVSCGCTHSAACTKTATAFEGSRLNRVKRTIGGHVYVAGPSSVLGKDRHKFHLVREMTKTPVKQVSCGYGNLACVTVDGELYTWGVNKGGSIGHAVSRKHIHRPKLVKCLYMNPKNLALHQKVRQSSVYNGRVARLAVDGDICGNGERFCCHTQVDAQPFWEVDLGKTCYIEKVHLWNREDSPLDSSSPPDMFTKRLFPCWIMVSASPFPRDLVDAYGRCAAKKKFTKDKRKTIWNLPPNTAARYVRVQLEGTGYLHFAQVEVFGTEGLQKPLGKIDSVFCGKEVMMAVSVPNTRAQDIETAYIRAVKADPANAFILRQYPTYFSAWDKHGFCDKIPHCPLDRGSIRCELCTLKNKWPVEHQAGPGGRLRRLDSLVQLVLQDNPPPSNYEIIKSKSESMVANMLKTVDTVREIFNKSSAKLMGRQIAKDYFGMTLHEADVGTGYLLDQMKQIKQAEVAQQEQEQEALRASSQGSFVSDKEDPAAAAGSQQAVGLKCMACDICEGFEPLRFNNDICKHCTHVASTHTKKISSKPKRLWVSRKKDLPNLDEGKTEEEGKEPESSHETKEA